MTSITGGVEAGDATTVAQPGMVRSTHAWNGRMRYAHSIRFRPSHHPDAEVYPGVNGGTDPVAPPAPAVRPRGPVDMTDSGVAAGDAAGPRPVQSTYMWSGHTI